ncbi:MAG: GIDE domain-containing protein [Desulfuromonadaceae bacterium]
MKAETRKHPAQTEVHIYIQPHAKLNQADNDLIEELAARGYADPYTLRQRLQGMFPAQLLHGSAEKMEEAARILTQHRRAYRSITPMLTLQEPETLESFTLGNGQVVLHSQSATLCCSAEHTILAIVADISARIGERQMKRMLARHTYGVPGNSIQDIKKLEEEIFRLAPILDLYRLAPEGNIEAGIRIIPGRFEHRHLGEDATLSRNRNLKVLWDKIRAATPDIRVHYGFGLSSIPECSPEPVTHADPYTHRGNLRALTRFGNLMAQLENTGDTTPSSAPIPDNFSALPLFGSLPQTAPSAPQAEETSATIEEDKSTLPPPPEATTLTGLKLHTNALRILPLAGVILAVGLSFLGSELNIDIIEYLFSHAIAQSVLAGVCFYYGIRYLRLKRHIENTPTSKIRSMAMGMVEIHGHVERKFALVSPVSGLPCVYYRIKRYTRKRMNFKGRQSENQWSMRSITTTENMPFLLNDGTGRVEINPRGAELKARNVHGGMGSHAQLPFSISSSMSENERWEEEVIPVGSYVYILGFARSASETNPGHKEQVRNALHALKQDQEKLQQFDSNHDGHIDLNEWDAARRATAHEVLTRSLHTDKTKTTPVQGHITHPPQRGYPFLIAETESELHLTRQFTYYGAIFLSAGLGLTLWGLYTAGKMLNFI